MRIDILDQKDNLLIWIKEGQSKAWISMKLRCKSSTLDKYLHKLGIVYKGNTGLKNIKKGKKKHASEFLYYGSKINSHKLKIKLINDGIKEKICENCRNTEWNGIDIPLHLHHLDGDRHNNELSNLKILCPNCHAQTDTYCGKHNKSKIIEKLKVTLIKELKKDKIEGKKRICTCGKIIDRRSKCCSACYAIRQRKVQNRPSKEELLIMIKDTNLEAVCRKYGVSGNAVKKWIK